MHEENTAALVIPAHTLKGEARQFGAEPLAKVAELIESTARLCIETHRFPDELVSDVVELRRLFEQTVDLFDKATNPLLTRDAARAVRAQGRQPGFRPDLGFGGGGDRRQPLAHRLQLPARQAAPQPFERAVAKRSSHGFDQTSISAHTSGTSSHSSAREAWP